MMEREFNIEQREVSSHLPTMIFIIFRDFLMLYQIFLSLQVKRWAIITYQHGIY